MSSLLDPSRLVKDFGYLGIFLTLFLESGVVIGFFLPGDSLLFAAGIAASQHLLNIVAIVILSVIAAILGNNTGYYTGKKFGHRLFTKQKSAWFSPKRLHEAHDFFERHGAPSLILARFIPAVRTFLPIIAGVAEMNWNKFFLFNTAGGLLWGIMLPVLGYTAGKTIHNADKYVLPIVVVIVIVSAIPGVLSYIKAKKH